MERRHFLATAAALVSSCRRANPTRLEPPEPPHPTGVPVPGAPRAALEVLDWEFPPDHGSARRCVVLVPRPRIQGRRYPVLIALHGLGETESPSVGAHGWLDRYELDQAIWRVQKPPLGREAFSDFVSDTRLAEVNRQLAEHPYGGLVIACPYVPREIGGEVTYEAYGSWLAEVLLPKIRAELPVHSTAESTGIDGVSLGGISALRIGLARADAFGVIGSLQPAVNDELAMQNVATSIEKQLQARPLRIVTSSQDAYRESLSSLTKELSRRGVPHEFLMTEGPHDYSWNKGPGSIEMLLWHDRKLARS